MTEPLADLPKKRRGRPLKPRDPETTNALILDQLRQIQRVLEAPKCSRCGAGGAKKEGNLPALCGKCR